MISIIVPAFNAEKTIKECVESILAQEFEEEFELIVIDDGSSDATVKVTGQFKEVFLLQQEHAGPAIARNSGAKKARGEIIVFTDADCVAAENWLREMISPFSAKNAIGVQGAYKTRQASLTARFTQLEIEERYERMKNAKNIDWIGSYSAAYKKKVFMNFGGFDESFPIASGEDPELSYRMAEKGLKLVFNPKAIVYHSHPNNFLKYLRTKFFRAYWRVLLYKKHPEKAISDSYTPQSLKLGIASIVLALAWLATWLAGIKSTMFLVFVVALFFASIIKPWIFAMKKDNIVGIFAPALLFFRDFSFMAGLFAGFIKRWAK